MINLDEARELVGKAAADPVSHAAREGVCRALAATFRSAGELLWVCGYTLGTDRRDGISPFGFGSDATVGLALVIEIAGELFAGAITLLTDGNLYGCAALSRQIVEVEYLTWAFAEDQEEAMMWLRSTPDERRRMWQPRHLRERAGDRFRAADYHRHCERGGHPTPAAETLLPAHRKELWPGLSWLDLAEHGVSAWRYTMDAADRLGYGDQIRSTSETQGLPGAIAHWEQDDRLRKVAAETLSSFRVS